MATKGRVVHEEYRAEIEVATVLILVASSGLRKCSGHIMCCLHKHSGTSDHESSANINEYCF